MRRSNFIFLYAATLPFLTSNLSLSLLSQCSAYALVKMGLAENICFGRHKKNWNCSEVSFFKNCQLFFAKITAGDGDCLIDFLWKNIRCWSPQTWLEIVLSSPFKNIQFLSRYKCW